jgi:DNA-binding transcriptional regulator YdaS (Cro superfamily)
MAYITRIIEMLGGTCHVARLCHVKPPVVSNWKFRNSIPAQHWRAIVRAAESQNVASVTYDLLGQIHAVPPK